MDLEVIISELKFKAIRSSGSGGQHVNKVASKVELYFSLLDSQGLLEEEKQLLFKNLKSRLTKDSALILQCGESRSQHKNKELVKQRFLEILQQALVVQKERIPTKIPKAVIKKRLTEKRKHADKKASRKKPDVD